MDSHRTTDGKRHVIELGILGLCLVLHAFALLLVAAYHASAEVLQYSTPLTLPGTMAAVREIEPDSLRSALFGFNTPQVPLLPLSVLCGILVLRATRHTPRHRWRTAYLLAQPILFFPGFLGIWFILFLPFMGPLDGEFLAEHTPTLLSMGLWIVGMMFIFWSSWRQAPVEFKPGALAAT